MKPHSLTGPTVLALLAGCAGGVPSELVDARSAYDAASKGPAAQLDPADLHAAQETLAVAEHSYQSNGDSDETKDIAYAAQRKAQRADANARTVAALQLRSRTLAQLQANKDAQATATTAQLASANQQLAVQGQQLQSERQQRTEAERRAAQAAADLARVASVKQDARGMVITISGGVLFASGQADLLPASQSKLSEVAAALTKQEPNSKLVVDGYTDSQGALAFNQQLSQRRAETVRTYLIQHGIAPDRISAEGFGPASPIADNASPEGRADNRRVEIVVQQNASAGAASTQGAPNR